MFAAAPAQPIANLMLNNYINASTVSGAAVSQYERPFPRSGRPLYSGRSDFLGPNRLKQHGTPMKVQEFPLAAAERPHIHRFRYLNAHLHQRRPVRNRRHNQPPIVLKPDEPAVEQVINGGGKE